jgi:hypothetical protein
VTNDERTRLGDGAIDDGPDEGPDEESPDESPAGTTTPRPPDGPDLMARYAPFLAIGAMIATFIVLPPGFALTLIGAIWLGLTRGLGRDRILSLTLTEALAWAAAIAIVEFLAALALFIASGGIAA